MIWSQLSLGTRFWGWTIRGWVQENGTVEARSIDGLLHLHGTNATRKAFHSLSLQTNDGNLPERSRLPKPLSGQRTLDQCFLMGRHQHMVAPQEVELLREGAAGKYQ